MSACAHNGHLDNQAASGLAAQHKAFQVSGECKLNFALAQQVQRSLVCLCKEVPKAKLMAAMEKALALIEQSFAHCRADARSQGWVSVRDVVLSMRTEHS